MVDLEPLMIKKVNIASVPDGEIVNIVLHDQFVKMQKEIKFLRMVAGIS